MSASGRGKRLTRPFVYGYPMSATRKASPGFTGMTPDPDPERWTRQGGSGPDLRHEP